MLNKIITYLYKQTPTYQADVLSMIVPQKPLFYKPLADASLLLAWENILIQSQYSGISKELRKKLSNIIHNDEYTDKTFNFGAIQSMTASKGFGEDLFPRINGSWFSNASMWGQSMYNDSPLSEEIPSPISGIDEADFKNNIQHIEREGFTKGSPLQIKYYQWFDRYIAVQSGGSHHAAMAIHQINSQGMTYRREARITHYKLDSNAAKELTIDNYVFITSLDAMCNHPKGFDGQIYLLLKEFVTHELEWIDMKGTESPSVLLIIPKNSLKIDTKTFEYWLSKNIRRGSVVDFLRILESPLSYCKNFYAHDIKNIYLGDPSRKNDKYVKLNFSELKK